MAVSHQSSVSKLPLLKTLKVGTQRNSDGRTYTVVGTHGSKMWAYKLGSRFVGVRPRSAASRVKCGKGTPIRCASLR